MEERRHNWKECVGKAAQKRNEKRKNLIARKDEIRRQILQCGTDYDLYDKLKAEQAEVMAQLAQLSI